MKKLLDEWDMEGARGVGTAGVKMEVKADEDAKRLGERDHAKFRRAAAQCNYIGLDRVDVAFAAKEISRRVSTPTEDDVVALKRLMRYLSGSPRLVSRYDFQGPVHKIVVCVDSDWAGCTRTRRSTSGGAAYWGSHLVHHWVKTQPVVALSSGEAELNAVLKGSAEGMHIKEIEKERGNLIETEVRSDSGACIGTVSRKGVGKIKHLEVKQLWVQERVAEKRIKIIKIPREQNPADHLTHFVTVKEQIAHLRMMSVEARLFGDS